MKVRWHQQPFDTPASTSTMTRVVVLGTCDTKLRELLFLRDHICKKDSVGAILIDAGRTPVNHESINISQQDLLSQFGNNEDISDYSRNDVIKKMSYCATMAVKKLYEEGSIHGIISAGGSGGSSLASEVMRNALPIGFPKVLVSTVASGDTGPIVGETDITLMYSVVDVAGLNQLLKAILRNSAAAIEAMAQSYRDSDIVNSSSLGKKRVGLTMFGVTTPAADAIRAHLESKYDVETFVFHATGHGGKAMERLIREGGIDAVLDLTTTEVCDLIAGGVMSAGPERLTAAAEAGIPNIVSVGATDMVNFGPKDTIPEKYKERKLYEHNPVVTLMRTSAEESQLVGNHIAKKLKDHSKSPELVEVWLPTRGLSMLSVPGAPFGDKDADAALFQALKDGLNDTKIRVIEYASSINDPKFAVQIAERLAHKMGLTST